MGSRDQKHLQFSWNLVSTNKMTVLKHFCHSLNWRSHELCISKKYRPPHALSPIDNRSRHPQHRVNYIKNVSHTLTKMTTISSRGFSSPLGYSRQSPREGTTQDWQWRMYLPMLVRAEVFTTFFAIFCTHQWKIASGKDVE